MKNLLGIIIAIFVLHTAIQAQNYAGMMDDGQRIAISTKIEDDSNITGQARQLLLSRMSNLINLNGLSAQEGTTFFSMVPHLSVLSHDVTATAPPMHATTLLLSLKVVDNFSGNIFGETSIEIRGVDQTQERAYSQAIRSINPRSGQLKVFMDRSKEQILAFYNTDCQMVISTAQSLVYRDRKADAIALLESVPKVSRECYELSMAYAAEIGPVAPPPPPVAEKAVKPADEPGETTATGRKGKIRDLEVELVSVEYKGNDIDITFVMRNDILNSRQYLYRIRYFDGQGNEASRVVNKYYDLVRGVPLRDVITIKGSNLDLIDHFLLIEYDFRSSDNTGKLRFENISVEK